MTNPSTVGIIGGGQLGRMLTEAAKSLDSNVIVLESTENPPAVQAGAEQIVGDLTNPEKIRELAEKSDFITWEIEHINTEVLEELEKQGIKINPSPKTLSKIKDKFLQKEFLKDQGIPTAPFKKVESVEEVLEASKELGLPLLLKTRFGGYDGRGNHLIKSEEEIGDAFERLGKENLYVEGFVDFEKELSVIAVRDIKGNIKTYPIVETIHENNILQIVLAPAPISSEQSKKAEEFAKKVLSHLEGAGAFGIEIFLTKSGEILVNEIAPRVHNSGHFTIEACNTSQFENHLRAVSEMELGSTEMKVGTAVMINILGDRTGEVKPQGVEEAEKLGNVFVHIYGKKEVKPERKMGHLTVVGENLDEVLEKANKARSLISI
jgi:5-(carboxyamino)imidazole ribonucleotide synthase